MAQSYGEMTVEDWFQLAGRPYVRCGDQHREAVGSRVTVTFEWIGTYQSIST